MAPGPELAVAQQPLGDRLALLLRATSRSARDAGARADVTDNRGRDPIGLAALVGKSEIFEGLKSRGIQATPELEMIFFAASGDHVNLEKSLLEGIDPNAEAGAGSTALMAAAKDNRSRCVEMLLARDAKMNRRNGFGYTALLMATELGHEEVVKLLLDAGADPRIENSKGERASDIAKRRGHSRILELLSDVVRNA